MEEPNRLILNGLVNNYVAEFGRWKIFWQKQTESQINNLSRKSNSIEIPPPAPGLFCPEMGLRGFWSNFCKRWIFSRIHISSDHPISVGGGAWGQKFISVPQENPPSENAPAGKSPDSGTKNEIKYFSCSPESPWLESPLVVYRHTNLPLPNIFFCFTFLFLLKMRSSGDLGSQRKTILKDNYGLLRRMSSEPARKVPPGSVFQTKTMDLLFSALNFVAPWWTTSELRRK